MPLLEFMYIRDLMGCDLGRSFLLPNPMCRVADMWIQLLQIRTE